MSKYKKNVSVKKNEMKISIITKKSPEMLSTQKYMTKFERPLCSSLKDNWMGDPNPSARKRQRT